MFLHRFAYFLKLLVQIYENMYQRLKDSKIISTCQIFSYSVYNFHTKFRSEKLKKKIKAIMFDPLFSFRRYLRGL